MTAMPPLPHDEEAEAAVLGAVIVDGPGFATVASMLNAKSFYSQKHAAVWSAMESLFADGSAIDVTTLAVRLRERDRLQTIGGASFLGELMDAAAAWSNVEHYGRIVADRAQRRDIILANRAAAELARDTSRELRSAAEKGRELVNAAAAARGARDEFTIGEAIANALDTHAKRCERRATPDAHRPMMTGFPSLDSVLGGDGLAPGSTHLFAGLPGAGKSALVRAIGLNCAFDARNVLLFSVEMKPEVLAILCACALAGVSYRQYQRLALDGDDQQKLYAQAQRVYRLPYTFVDCPAPSIGEIRARCKAKRDDKKLDLVIVDYLQRVTVPGAKSEYESVSTACAQLVTMAKELDVPVIVVSSVTAPSQEGRGAKSGAQTGKIRGSGAAAYDADFVCFMSADRDDASCVNFSTTKNKYGTAGPEADRSLRFDKPCFRFSEHNTGATPPYVEEARERFEAPPDSNYQEVERDDF